MNPDNLPEKAAKIYKKIRKKYKVEFDNLKLRDHELKVLQVADIEPLLAGKDPFADVSTFPFWVRLWEAAIVLADLLVAQPLPEGKKLLELGAGLGAPGLAAALVGYEVTLSDYEQHIMGFQKVSAAANGLDTVQFALIDWLKPPKLAKFDTIIAAEILFRDEFFAPLLKVFRKYLAPGGAIYLAHDLRRKSLPKFLELAEKDYDIAFSKRKLTSEDGDIHIMVNRLTARD